MKGILMLVFGVVCAVSLFMWCSSGVKETQEHYGGNYENCLQDFKASECKRIFLD